MKKVVKLLSLALVFTFLLGILSAFAAEEKPLYVVLGDSIARGVGVKNRNIASFGAIVANSNDFTYQNFAIGGYEATDVLADLQKEDIREAVMQADIISLSVGGNDFLHSYNGLHVVGGLLFQNYKLFDAAAQTFYKNFSALMQEIKTLNPTAFITLLTVYNPRFDVLQKTYQEGADRINAVLWQYLAENPGSYAIVDVAADFQGDISMIAQDQLHPSAKGHEKIAEGILQCLYANGLGTTTQPVLLEEAMDDEGDFWENLLRSIINVFLKVIEVFLP